MTAAGAATRLPRWIPCGPAAVHVALWLLLPSQRVHPDALDEVLLVEGPRPVILAKHPAAEPAVWAVHHLLLALGDALGVTLLGAASFAALHLAVDPYLLYWPPGPHDRARPRVGVDVAGCALAR